MEIPAKALDRPQDDVPGDAADASKGGGGIWRVLLVAAVLIGGVLTLHLTPIRSYFMNARDLRDRMTDVGVWIYPLTILIVAALLACGVPRLAVHAAGGMMFGFGIGFALTFVGAILGHYFVFLFIRWGGRDWVLGRWPKMRKWAELMEEHGVVAVILARQLPAHAMLINACLALSHVRHRDFLIGTAIGLLPEAIPATLIGAGLMKASLKDSASYLTIAAAAFAVIWIASGYALRRLRKDQARSIKE